MNRKHTTWAAALLVLTVAPSLAQSDDQEEYPGLVRWDDLLGEGSRLQLYGFLRADVQWSDSRFNDVQIPGYVRSEDPAAPPGVGAEEDDSEFAVHARLTRLGANFSGPPVGALGDPALTGTVEVDFYNSGLPDSDSRSALRMRKAYVQLGWEHWTLLAGQTWDLISPLYPAVNHDLVMWGAGNTGDRRPQVRAEYRTAAGPGDLSAAFGIGLSGAVAGPDVQGGLRSGENSGEPMVNARLGYDGETSSGGAWQAGVWGHQSSEDYDALGNGTDQRYDSSSIGVDFRAPLYRDEVWLLGEWFTGENLDDVRGGIFQGVNGATGDEIASEGGWLELGLRATEHVTLHLGYSLDDPDDDDLSTNARSKNEVAYAAARWSYGALHFGLEYLNWETGYVGLDGGDANRLQGYIAFYF